MMRPWYHVKSSASRPTATRTSHRTARHELPALEALETRELLSGIQEYSALLTNNTNGGPTQVAISGGNLWFTEPTADTVGVFSMTSNGVADQLTLSDENGNPPGIAATSESNAAVFFTLSSGGQLGVGSSTSPSQSPAIFNLFSGQGTTPATSGITLDGANLWLTGLTANELLEVSPSPTLPTLEQNPIALPASVLGFEGFNSTIITGPNGVLFFTEATVGSGGAITASGIGSYNPSNGDFSQYLLPTTGGVQEPFGLADGPDGNIWFTAAVPNGGGGFGASYVGAINPSAMSLVTELQAPTGSQPNGITVGPDNDIWFTETGAGAIGTVIVNPSDPAADALGTAISIPTSVVAHPAPTGITTASNGTMWFADSAGAIGQLVVPTHIAVTVQPPPDVSVGTKFGVTFTDDFANGAVDTQFSGTVSLATTANPNTAIAQVSAANGVAMFSNLSLGAGTYQLVATSSGTNAPSAATTNSFLVVNGAATKLVVTTQPTSPVTAGTAFAITVTDEFVSGPTDTSFTGNVSLALSTNPSAPVATVSAVNGVATFTGLTLNTPGATYVYEASASGLAIVNTNPITVAQTVSPTPTPTPPPTPAIILDQIYKVQKHNKKGKPIGKPVFAGFEFEYSEAMGASATNAANYTVEVAVIKRIKRKNVTTYKPIAFTTSFNSGTNTMILNVSAKQTFPKGGQIIINGTSPGGVASSQGAFLNGGTNSTFTVTPKLKKLVVG
jgi:streptogramin lyase